MAAWLDTPAGRAARRRRASVPVPEELSIELLQHRDLLVRWVRKERQEAARASLLKESGDAGIERAEAACELLLREGWIERRERLEGGSWQWHGIAWRDLEGLQRVLGVAGRQQRDAERQQVLSTAQEWLRARAADDAALDPDLQDELAAALEQLGADRTMPLDALRTRMGLLRALVDWHDAGSEGLRRDFALRAGGATKAIGAADWRWLEASFDLERLRIEQFSPTLWLAGDAGLQWGPRRLDAGAVHCLGVPLQDILRADACTGSVTRYWLIENRASFERQARGLPAGVFLLWMPGRPSTAWRQAVSHLLRLAPAPGWISADVDPAGVDIARSVGALWAERGLSWEPHRMGLPEWQSTEQRWPLNDHDRALLGRLLADDGLASALRSICEAMLREGRKAEQEGWL
ncbi:DUF2399 domain-containing protein [Ramlibacter sp. G-1-2-2]|uniref:DUF2399 domain-containing protein n=1 Tax=Ramlibacter agri TaxID=2728837 RepID=A0A848H884_9BURK|nr:DUF2399 domain-containing protein [Ramlibacter agri]